MSCSHPVRGNFTTPILMYRAAMGYAMKQIYAVDDQYYYMRPAPQALRNGSTLLQDPNLKVREDYADLSKLVEEISSLTVIESTDLCCSTAPSARLISA
jgi:hypothetical protein